MAEFTATLLTVLRALDVIGAVDIELATVDAPRACAPGSSPARSDPRVT